MTTDREVLADIRATIRHWRNRGVRAAEIAPYFRCDKNWPAIEFRMVKLAYDFEERQREAAD